MARLPPFDDFFDEHAALVWRLCRVLCPRDAEDCVQETFLAALRAYPSLRHGSNLRAWVLRIAYGKAMDAHRARRRIELRAEVPDVPVDGAPPGDPALWRAVRALPERQRKAVAFRFVCDLPYREVAAALGSSEAAARQSVREAIRKLREVIE